MMIEENIKLVAIDDEMKDAYLDYAMSVIVGRALPDVRDGLKPVHRRILYALKDLNITSRSAHKKSARIVGEVLGKYHPHGDTSVYDAMVRMAQDFSHRYPLVDGHGNFGSVDGDAAAAMRYTEARMAKISEELVKDIDKETVDFKPNFDDTLQEPEVLPARIPNLLINGSSGIAVGMATSVPPHNLGEVIEGVVRLIDDSNISVTELMQSIQGPDFPTGGSIMNRDEIIKAYRTGRGKVRVRAKTRIINPDSKKPIIIVDELPYQVNKAKLIEKIADLVKEDKITGISDLRDESDRDGMRIFIELKSGTNPDVMLNKLFKNTQLQTTFSVIMLALVNNQPKVLSLKEVLYHYLQHQKDVVRRRTTYDLNKAEDRAHVLAGFRIALADIDEVVELIKKAPDSNAAALQLERRFGLSERQADSILSMQLKRLTGLEREKIEEEYSELQEQIAYLRSILSSEEKLIGLIREELLEIKEKYQDERRTDILNQDVSLEMEDLIAEENIVVALTNFGYIKRMPLDIYRSQKRGGKGIIGISTRDEDFVADIFTATTHRTFMFFTNKGQVYRLKGYQIPQAGRQARGTAIINLLDLDENEKISAIIPIDEFYEDKYLLMVTQRGIIKKTALSEYDTNYTGLQGIQLREDDELVEVKLAGNDDSIFVTSREGKSIHFEIDEVRETARSSIGVKAIDLIEEDEVIGAGLASEGEDLFVITEKGYGKRTSLEEYRTQHRGGKGLITANISAKIGKVAQMKVVDKGQELLIITQEGIMIRVKVSDISTFSRNTQGVKVISLNEGDKVISLAKIDIDPELDQDPELGQDAELIEEDEDKEINNDKEE
ncbi:MAG: DNA gyrase subunit A [Bacillota bacterium]